MRLSRLSFTVGLAALALITSVCGVASGSPHERGSSQAHGAPVFRNPPAAPPKTLIRHRVCSVPMPNRKEPRAHGRVWVDPAPTGATAVWLPGLNDKQCKARITSVSAKDAVRIARAVDHAASPKPNTPYSCPADDETGVHLYLSYPSGTDEYLRVGLTGCASVDAPGRAVRWLPTAARHALAPSAPAAWKSYVD